jgi:hypothetical protein
LNIFLFRSGVLINQRNEMKEHYKGTTILITARDRKLKWEPTCQVTFMKGGREVVKDLELDLDYVTAEQAERAGLVFSKKWIDAGKPLT